MSTRSRAERCSPQPRPPPVRARPACRRACRPGSGRPPRGWRRSRRTARPSRRPCRGLRRRGRWSRPRAGRTPSPGVGMGIQPLFLHALRWPPPDDPGGLGMGQAWAKPVTRRPSGAAGSGGPGRPGAATAGADGPDQPGVDRDALGRGGPLDRLLERLGQAQGDPGDVAGRRSAARRCAAGGGLGGRRSRSTTRSASRPRSRTSTVASSSLVVISAAASDSASSRQSRAAASSAPVEQLGGARDLAPPGAAAAARSRRSDSRYGVRSMTSL